MSDGAQGAGQDTPNHQICIKTWTCTLPDSLEEITPGQGDIAEQYTRFLDQLESGDGLRKHCVDFLAVSRASETFLVNPTSLASSFRTSFLPLILFQRQ